MRKYCLNCGKKFYAKAYYSYPDTEYEYDYENRTSERHEVPLEQYCGGGLGYEKILFKLW